MKMNGAEIIVKFLETYEVEYVAGIPGGTNLPLYDALSRSNTIKHILTKHEQGAGFIAQGISRTSNKPGVCLATSGPGVTNLLTAIADAKLDSIPLIAITGQVPYSLMGTDAFQEVDTYGMTLPITKHNFIVREAKQLLEVIPEAFKIAMEGRPGPVVIDVPKDVQLEIVEVKSEFKKSLEGCNIKPGFKSNQSKITDISKKINEAKKPVLYVGGGVILAKAWEELTELAVKNNIPVASTLMGIGAFSCKEKLNLGMLGMHGSVYTNTIMEKADLIIALGVRFDDRATGKVDKFCSNAEFIHLDIDVAEINKIKPAKFNLISDLKVILEQLIPLIDNNTRNDWMTKIESIKKEYPNMKPNSSDIFHPINIIKSVGNLVHEDSIVTTDVGQHQMWVAQSYPFNKPRSLITSGGLGTMGFGLPTAIGVSLANPDKTVVSFVGDGSIYMNIQELATLAELDLNIKIIILNNGCLGMVRQQQELVYNGNLFASKFESKTDFVKVAEGFGVKSLEIDSEEILKNKLEEILSEKGPCLINIPIPQELNVHPMVVPGKGNTEIIGGQIK